MPIFQFWRLMRREARLFFQGHPAIIIIRLNWGNLKPCSFAIRAGPCNQPKLSLHREESPSSLPSESLAGFSKALEGSDPRDGFES